MHRLERELTLPAPIVDVFAFFSEAGNLELLTPSWLRFRITSPQPIEMRVGARIDYRLRVYGIPLSWTSEITAWDPPHRFVDEQRRGPYRSWIHEHRFEDCAEGTRVQDIVDYAVPGGALVAKLFVDRDLRRIFDHRREQMLRRFGGELRDS